MSNLKYKIGDEFNDIRINHDLEIKGYADDGYSVLYHGKNEEVYVSEKHLLSACSQIILSTQIGGRHYSGLEIDPYEYSMVNNLNPLQMNAIKYITRYPFKNGIEDLEKAKHTIDRLIDYEKKNS